MLIQQIYKNYEVPFDTLLSCLDKRQGRMKEHQKILFIPNAYKIDP